MLSKSITKSTIRKYLQPWMLFKNGAIYLKVSLFRFDFGIVHQYGRLQG